MQLQLLRPMVGPSIQQCKMVREAMPVACIRSQAGAELFTLSELHSEMVEYAGESEVYILSRV